jgi:hypothetical protein
MALVGKDDRRRVTEIANGHDKKLQRLSLITTFNYQKMHTSYA